MENVGTLNTTASVI